MRTRAHRTRVSHDRWLVSYADFITLLFAFFVVLYASANADKKKQQDVSAAIDAAFRSLGIFPSATQKPSDATGAAATADHPVVPMNIVMGEDVMSPSAVKDDLERIRRDLTQALSNQVATHTVSIKMGRDGLVISLREAGFFDSVSRCTQAREGRCVDSAPDCVLRLGATPLRRPAHRKGHTDNIPIPQ